MKSTITKKRLTLIFSSLEARVLEHILQQVIANYGVKPEELDPKAASAWYSTRGCKRVKMSEEETREWLANLHQYKSANVQHLRRWCRTLSALNEDLCRLTLKLEDAPILLSALNDHRLWMAAKHDVGQEEMDARSLVALTNLAPEQQIALSEIHFLACIMEEILQCLPGNPGAWMTSENYPGDSGSVGP